MRHANTANQGPMPAAPAVDAHVCNPAAGHPAREAREHGFSSLELVFVLTIVLVMVTIALPYITTTVHTYSVNNDARGLAGQLSLARMRAASSFSRARLLCDPSAFPQCRIQLQGVNTSGWTDEGTVFGLASGDSFGIAQEATSGAGGQSGTPQQPPQATSPYTPNLAPYAIEFNSRGTPIDPSTGSLKSDYALYVQGSGMYAAVAVDNSGQPHVYRFVQDRYVLVKD